LLQRVVAAHYNDSLASPDQSVAIDVVLVRPRNPLNIGAVARAMANFGFVRLVVVDPYEPHWREARSAVDSEQVMKDAVCMQSVAEAVQNATLVLGTGSLEARKPEQPVVQLPAVTPIVQAELARAGRVAIVFGPEKHGLTRDDLSWCHRLIEIPTGVLQPSMNLGQAVAVCLYELSAHALPAHAGAEQHPAAASQSSDNTLVAPEEARNISADLDRLAGLIEQVMTASNYSPNAMQEANRHDLRLSLRRLTFTRRDLRRALGLFRRVLHALDR